MYIDNSGLENYNARLLSRSILPSTFEVRNFWGRNSLSPIVNENVKRRYKKLLISVEFKGSPEEIEVNKSRLIRDITISEVRFNSLPNIYEGNVSTIELIEQVSGYESHSIELNVIELEDEREVSFSNSTIVIVNSTDVTPCILELTSAASVSNVLISGLGDDIMIKNMVAGKKIAINGIKGTVTQEGINDWLNYDSWGFPKLLSGENNISINKSNVSAKLIYKARWI